MADVKITALTALAATPANNDLVPVVDVSAGETKKVLISDFLAGVVISGKSTSDLAEGLNLYFTTARVNTILTAGTTGLFVKEGANARMGVATLVAGTVTVATTAVTANSRIFAFAQAAGGVVGVTAIANRVAATSFDIVSSSATDTSTMAWVIVEPT